MSEVNGEAGSLIIRGHRLYELVGHVTFEDLFGLLIEGALPSPTRRIELQAELGAARMAAWQAMTQPYAALKHKNGMDALRASTAQLSSTSGPVDVVGALAVFAAAWSRQARGLSPVAPDPEVPHAADYLHMMHDAPPTAAAVTALDSYLCTVSDHGMNASTFAARVVTSTESDLVSSVVAAIGALKGRLHGGAPGPVLDMLDAVGTPDRARAWIESQLDRGKRIMGMGHRIYRVRDPRAAVLEGTVEELDVSGTAGGRLALARAVERAATELLDKRYPTRRLRANVEFYTAVLLECLAIPREAFTPTFAVGRVIGWCAHIHEQRETGRLIRPKVRYVGPRPAS